MGCPRIDDIGGKVHNELNLDSRLHDFKRDLLVSTLHDCVFKVHQAMLAYALTQPEVQGLSVVLPARQLDPREEAKESQDGH